MHVHDGLCGMTIESDEAAPLEFLGETYCICADRCRGMFEGHPDRFAPVPDDWERAATHSRGEDGGA